VGELRLLYAEDLVVGQRFELGSYTISEEEIVGFAKQYDPVPIHTDKEARLPRGHSVASLQAASTPWLSTSD
jgi:acyl dehydratase